MIHTHTSIMALQDYCKARGLECIPVDTAPTNAVYVSNGKNCFVANPDAMYPLNPESNAKLVKDKAWTYKVLEQKGYRIPIGDFFFLKKNIRGHYTSGKEIEDALSYASSLGFPVFVKPNRGSRGVLASIILNECRLKEHLEMIAQIDPIGIVQKKVSGEGYRIFLLDGNVEFIIRHAHTQFLGISERTRDWSSRLVNDLGLRIAGIDVFSDQGVDNPDCFTVLEVNSNPGLSNLYKSGHHNEVMGIWDRIMDSYFGKASSSV